MAKTKVICTIGPATASEEMLEKLINAGMSIARCNMSHAWTPEIVEVEKNKMLTVRKLNEKLGSKCQIALDTKGPDVRIGTFENGRVDVLNGTTFKFYFGEANKKVVGTATQVFVPYEKLLKIVKVGSTLALNDGHVVMEITEIAGSVITARVVAGGVLKNNKSLAAPGHDLELPFISPEDEVDFKMGLEVGVDWIMASAVSKVQDVVDLRNWLKTNGGAKGAKVKIMSKIEDRIGVKNLDGIISASDAIMVARGGLGTDIGLDLLPARQKEIVAKTRAAGKEVVVATEMFESMTEKPNCTRAEALDVANAVWDGANYVMLSGETAAGKYPVQCVEFMLKIAADAEKHKEYFRVK
jgi:pyruvate kinase